MVLVETKIKRQKMKRKIIMKYKKIQAKRTQLESKALVKQLIQIQLPEVP